MVKQERSDGFATILTIVVLVIVVIGFGGWYIWHSKHNPEQNNQTVSTHTENKSKQNATQDADPYSGWQTATSSRAGFSIKYPSDWTYNSAVGPNDGVEHINISSTNFRITISSYSGKDAAHGGQPATACPDCLQTQYTSTFTVPKLGNANLKTIIYKLDSGEGNALILEFPDSTYFIASPTHSGVTSSFRGISVLDSEKAYQTESPSQFVGNKDYETAKKILESLSY